MADFESMNDIEARDESGTTYDEFIADAVKKAVDCMAQADTISSMFRPEIKRILSSIKHAGDMANPESAVEHPAHYNHGRIEVWDAVADWGLNFDLGNVIKYVARAGHKDPAKRVEDLKKAMEYLKHELERAGDIK